jgi:hypothetical protein
MNRNETASPKSLFCTLAGVVAVAVMSGCAAIGTDVKDPIDSLYQGGASLEPDLGSVALRVADTAPPLREKSGI